MQLSQYIQGNLEYACLNLYQGTNSDTLGYLKNLMDWDIFPSMILLEMPYFITSNLYDKWIQNLKNI